MAIKALIADDSKVVRSVTGRILQQLGINYEEAADGEEALQKVREEIYDFIILDWVMPNCDGMEFLRRASKEDILGDTKVIFCTTESEIERISEAIENGASEYIMKPFDKEILESKLNIIGVI